MLKHITTAAIGCLLGFGVQAQDCSHFLYFQKDKVVEITIYNKKGEPNGKQVYTVSDVSTNGGGVTAKLNSELFDKKGKSMAKSNSAVQCNGGVISLDMKLMLPQQQQEQMGDANANAQGDFIDYPAGMKVGDQLKDGNLTMDIKHGGMTNTLTMVISERKVLAQESVTTPAGTWDCFKISAHAHTVVKTGPIGIPFNNDYTEWYAPGFGIVKSEGKSGGTAITSIK